MCYEVLQDDRVTDRSIGTLLHLETRDAVINGLEAAALVTLVLLWQGTPLWLVGISAVAAIALGAALHQLLLVVAAAVIRRRARRSGAGPTPS